MSFVRSSLAPKNSELLSLVFSAAAQDGCNAPDRLACLQPFTCKTEEQDLSPELHEEHAEQHAHHPQDAQEVLAMTFEELNASLQEPPVDFDPTDSASMLNTVKQLQHTQ